MQQQHDNRIKVCVFGSSSQNTKQVYLDAAQEFGRLLAKQNFICVNGGGKYGVMGAINIGCREEKGTIIGVIHEKFVFDSEEDQSLTKMIVCKGNDLNERKRLLFTTGDCLVVAPGGVGTFDEMWDSICAKSLKMNDLENKPICLLNIDGFFDGSIQQLNRALQDGVLYEKDAEAYFHVANTPQEALQWCQETVTYRRNHPHDFEEENSEGLQLHRMKARENKISFPNATTTATSGVNAGADVSQRPSSAAASTRFFVDSNTVPTALPSTLTHGHAFSMFASGLIVGACLLIVLQKRLPHLIKL